MTGFKKSHIISEEVLISMILNTPSQGIKILYENYSGALKKQISRLVDNRESAEDILQESFIKIWKNFARYETSKGRLYTWMVNIARNEAIDFLRSKKLNNTKNSCIESVDLASYEHLNFRMIPEHIGIKELVAALDPGHESIVNLLHYQGYSQSEASDYLNIPLGTVKTKARQAYVSLRKSFAHENVELYSQV